jgi:hypothetical protein
MDDTNNTTGNPSPGYKVGFGRPPEEHQFKKGQKRPARKKKPEEEGAAKVPLSHVLRKVLNEPRRVVINDKVRYVSGAELVIRRAYQEAEKGNATLRRELARLLLNVEEAEPASALSVRADPNASEHDTGLRLMDEAL